MTRTVAALTLLALLAPARPARAQAGLLVPTRTGRPDPGVLSLREMVLEVGIARGYARVNLRQVFENHTGQVQEGTYRFRLPPRAAVGDFAVWDDLVRIPGVILEKQRARAIYRELTTQRIDPGLLQQGEEEDRAPGAPGGLRPSGGALFSVKVSPIPPHATKRLELQFQQEVPFIEGQGEFRLGLRPPDGEPPVAASFRVRVRIEDGELVPGRPTELQLVREGADYVFSGSPSPLDRDLVVRVTSRDQQAMRLAAFRNPEGVLPDGLALAPWERPSEIPPETDGFFLLEALPPAARRPTSAAGAPAQPQTRAAVSVALLFDTSLSHRWSGLETAYAHLVRVLQLLTPKDRFALLAFDREPAGDAALRPATPEAVEAALAALRARPLRPGTDVPRAVAAARALTGEAGRLLLLTDGPADLTSKALTAARGGALLFTALTGEESPEAYRGGSTHLLPPGAAEIETDLFFRRLLGPAEPAAAPRGAGQGRLPFTTSGGDARLRDVYPVLVQPLVAGSLSGWVGRYGVPQPQLRWELQCPLVPEAQRRLDAPLPERALEARDLPRRWARARVDYLLARIEAEGERREWVDEIIALSKRYKFVTPYTAFLAAPRSLLRPRRIQPGDPVLRVECDPGTVSAVALFPFGLRLPLTRQPGTRTWEGRFLVPEGLPDGRQTVRIVLTDVGGGHVVETKSFVVDGRPPVVQPDALAPVRAGETVRVTARTDEDVVLLQARLGDAPPVPLRWDESAKRAVGLLRVPAGLSGRQEIVFEAVDGAKNHGFGRLALEVLQ